MRFAFLIVVSWLVLPAFAQADELYGDIGKIKLAKPEDGKNVKSVPPPKGAIVLFNGKNLDSWTRGGKNKPTWILTKNGAMQVKGGSIRTKEKFGGNFKLHVEFRVPSKGGSNSGVYVQGRYEIQVINGYGRKPGTHSCGSIYGQAAPTVNACKAPTIWQSYDIEFHSPVCKEGKVVKPGLITIQHNGVKIHDNVKLTKATGGSIDGNVCQPGPVMLQDHGAPVQYRNVWLLPLKSRSE